MTAPNPSAPTLLPGNRTALEAELSRTWASLDALDPVVIETLWDAWACPARYLPWLAWSLSVDLWDDGWDEIRKRQAIADSPTYHRIKGSRLAVELALALLQRDTALTEWWETSPRGRRGTNRLFVALADGDDVGAIIAAAQRLVRSSKPKSRPVTIVAGISATSPVGLGAATVSTDILTVLPYVADMPEIDSPILILAGTAISDRLTVMPRTP